jgi:hypothetical protein
MALKHWMFGVAFGLGAFPCAQLPVLHADPFLKQDPAATIARLKKNLFYLASPYCEGRGPKTSGSEKAGEYIADRFALAGLKPGGVQGGYFQPFRIQGANQEGPGLLSFLVNGQQMVAGEAKDFSVYGLSGSGKAKGGIVFCGYGIEMKDGEGDKAFAYDDFAGVPVEGKVVVILRETPAKRPDGSAFAEGGKVRTLGSITEKVAKAVARKAAAVLVVNNKELAGADDPLVPFDFTSFSPASRAAKVPVFHVKRNLVDKILKDSGKPPIQDLEKKISESGKPDSFELAACEADLGCSVRRGANEVPLRNVVGVLEGKGPRSNETVVIGAHYDHVGYGGFSSLAQVKMPTLHPGADDNASGTTALLELAHRFGSMPDREGRRLVFIAFSGEELGLYGSVAYCANPLFPLEETAAMVNLDMVGRLRPEKMSGKDRLLVQGVGTATEFDALIEKLNKGRDFYFVKQQSGFGPSDHNSFCAKKRPVLFFWTDVHEDYHRPTDLPERINYEGMTKIIDFAQSVVQEVSTVSERPSFVEVARSSSQGRPMGNRPRLGIRPGYNEGETGVLVEGVSPGEAAEKAGIKLGDRIVEMGGKPVQNIEGYMQLMGTLKPGTTIDLTVLRKDQKVNLKVQIPMPVASP